MEPSLRRGCSVGIARPREKMRDGLAMKGWRAASRLACESTLGALLEKVDAMMCE